MILSLISNATDVCGIIEQKQRDIERFGYAIWVINSVHCRVRDVQKECERVGGNLLFAVITSLFSSPGNRELVSKFYSSDGKTLEPFPVCMDVRGNIRHNSCGLVIDSIRKSSKVLETTSYATSDGKTVRFHPGCSAELVYKKKKDDTEPKRKKMRYMVIVANVKTAVYLHK